MLSFHRLSNYRAVIFLLLACFSMGRAYADQKVTLAAKGHEISASVAATFAQRKQGLMNRKSLGENEGMLFVFPREERHAMWMKNTLIPLGVAFIDTKGVIINIAEMVPLSLDQHAAQKPAKYALEMNAGWFQSHGIQAGDTVSGLAQAGKSPSP
jgi:uncharacterized membrane protein (UPF0127 family)